jgi:hypothetical protein
MGRSSVSDGGEAEALAGGLHLADLRSVSGTVPCLAASSQQVPSSMPGHGAARGVGESAADVDVVGRFDLSGAGRRGDGDLGQVVADDIEAAEEQAAAVEVVGDLVDDPAVPLVGAKSLQSLWPPPHGWPTKALKERSCAGR